MNLSSVYLKLIALGAIIIALGALHYIDKGYALRAQENSFKARLETSVRIAEGKAREIEKQLAQNTIIKEQEKNEKLASINTELSASISRLSKRPSRPTDNSPASPVSQACTGRELYKEDGEFLIREAARAEALIVERDFYYDRYEQARISLAKQGQDGGRHGEVHHPVPVP